MNIDSMFPSNYLKASDAEGNPTLTMQDVKIEKMKNRDGEEEEKPVLYFVEVEKGMVLNRTNAQTISGMYGDDTDNWISERITLTSVDVSAFGQTKPALRVSSKKPGVSKQAILDRFSKLYEKARGLGVEGIEAFAVTPNMTEQQIIQLGKDLKTKVEAVEAF
jgi:hypothetical protein